MLAGCHRAQGPQALYDAIHLQFVQGDVLGSQTAADRAVARFAGNDPAWEWKFRFLEATIRIQQGESAEALALMQSPIPASLQSPDYAIQRYALRATALTWLGKLSQAEREAQEARGLSEQTHSRYRVEACAAAGLVDLELNKFADADALFGEAREAANARSDSFLEAKMLINEGVVSLRQEHYDAAFTALNAGAQLARSIGAKLMLESALGNSGWGYHEIGDHERARADFAEASKQAEMLGNQLDEVRWLNNLGEEEWQLGDLEGAEASYKKALPVAQSIHNTRETASVEMDLAWLLYDRRQYAGAEQMCDPALAAAREIHDSATELDLVSLKGLLAMQRGERKEAQTRFQQIDSSPESLPSQRLYAQDAIAGLYDDSNQAHLAEIWYRKAVDTFEKQRATIRNEESRLPFFANAEGIYPDFAEFLIHHRREEEALRLIDTGRARSLEEGLGLKAGGVSPVVRDADVNPRALAAKLHAVLLEYALGDKQSWLWIATPQQFKLVQLPAKAEISAQISAYRKAILHADDVLATRNAAGIALYDTLIAPVQGMIPAHSRVFVLPDGVLNELNFETLLVSKPQPHFWIDDVTVENANSLRLLNSFAGHAAAKQRASLLLIGDPASPAGAFNDLLNAPQEVASVADHFPADHRVVLTRDKSFPRAYGESHPERFTYIHFVAHGTASRLEPLESAIVLSGNPGHPQEYRLLARDIIHIPLHADLVTISTCYGSGSREYAGEGLLGLSWSFLRAGAHSVVGALWEVSDLSTPQLMDRLYSGMEQGHPPDEALREAKLSLAHSQGTFRKPFYWAAFQVYAGS